MADDFTRSITFVIPGSNHDPSVQVSVVEVDGSLEFTMNVLSTKNLVADLRGLFFDVNSLSKLDGLTYDGNDVTGLNTGGVIDMGQGVNMKGSASPFDVGISFGTPGIGQDSIQTTTFTLSNSLNNLTLDDIANVMFGARTTSQGGKMVVQAPAAPDAINDSYSIFEDGQQGLNSPSSTPTGQIFEVLANDTDADGDTLTITAVKGAEHGTVQIVDGADADLLPGDAVLYTPFEDYSGQDSFMYSVSDNNGGTDFATANVDIVAVADKPDLSYQVLAGSQTNELILRVTATQTDADSSEFIDGLTLSGIPDNVEVDALAYNPADEPDQITRDFLITLPTGVDTNFDLGVTAVSQEVSNGDTESATVNVPIALEYTSNNYDLTFVANDQNMWAAGDSWSFTDDRFIGLETSWNESGSPGMFYYNANGSIKAGFQSTLDLSAGSIDASVPYDITIETNYNKATDVLQISSAALMDSGALFSTEGPGGSYNLDFIFQFFSHTDAGADIDIDLLVETLHLYNDEIFNFNVGPWDYTYSILDIDDSDLSYETGDFYGFSLAAAWPEVNTTSDPSTTNVITSDGESNNFLQLNLDVDDLLAEVINKLAGNPGPAINPFDLDFGNSTVWANVELADLDVYGGANFVQDFTMTVNGLPGIITYEDGTTASFTFGNDIILTDASIYDQDGDGVEFSVALDPSVALNNNTDLGFNIGYEFDLLYFSWGFDIGIYSDSFSLNPVDPISGDAQVATIGVYDSTFDLSFENQTVNFVA